MTITERHPDGRAKSSTLTSQKASEMGKRSHQVLKDNSHERLILEAGYSEDDNPCPEHMRILAKQAITSTPAMNSWIKLTNKTVGPQDMIVVNPGDKCPICHQWVLSGLQMNEEDVGAILVGVSEP